MENESGRYGRYRSGTGNNPYWRKSARSCSWRRLGGGNFCKIDFFACCQRQRHLQTGDRAGAVSDDHTKTFPGNLCESANRRALGCDRQSARGGEKEKWQKRAITERDDRLGGC